MMFFGIGLGLLYGVATHGAAVESGRRIVVALSHASRRRHADKSPVIPEFHRALPRHETKMFAVCGTYARGEPLDWPASTPSRKS